MNKTSFKTVLQAGIWYSLLFILLTAFLQKCWWLITGQQTFTFPKTMFPVFSGIYAPAMFVLLLALAHNRYLKKSGYHFNGIQFTTVVFLLFCSIFSSINGWLFYHANRLLHPAAPPRLTGLPGLLESFSSNFGKPVFDPVDTLIITPYRHFRHALQQFSISTFIAAVVHSKIILTTLVIFYGGLFRIFKRFKRNGWPALLPVINHISLLRITGRPLWWVIPGHIPFVRLIVKYFIHLRLARAFNKNISFAAGLTLLPWYFYGRLGFEGGETTAGHTNIPATGSTY